MTLRNRVTKTRMFENVDEVAIGCNKHPHTRQKLGVVTIVHVARTESMKRLT